MFANLPLDETSQILKLNELAMSSNPVIASTARISKDLIPITTKVLERELRRCGGDAIVAYSSFIQGIVMNTIVLPASKGDLEEAMHYLEELKRLSLDHFDRAIKELPSIFNQATEEN